MISTSKRWAVLGIALLLSSLTFAQKANPLEGRWDLEVEFNGKTVPSWLEIRKSGVATLIGRYVSYNGSARPIAEVVTKDNGFSFVIPRQWEPEGQDMKIEGKLDGDALSGTMTYTDGSVHSWEGVKSPKIPYNENPDWGETRDLFNGKNLYGWHNSDIRKGEWSVKDGLLTNSKPGSNLITNEKFLDFKLHAEFRFPEGSNSGIYLRGRYEVQIADNAGLEPSDIYFGGIYGFLEPNENAAKPANEWQTYDITLIGRRVTIVANGKTIISDQTIPGITGGALDSREWEPGPIMIQGDHGPVEFRSLKITTVKPPQSK
ncbi:3-keto-disaccharide hydrolase [Flagellimonas sp.]|uniref:3-keto-disaccharide hydrolase n=1 Tax=Flagellimonas sp. TaxID=2058762 RepID=UPI003BAFEE94